MNWISKATRWERKPSSATGICETPAGGNVFGGASNRSPKGLDETPQSVARGGSLAARGKRVYSSCGDRSVCFVPIPFPNTQLFSKIWKELLKRSTSMNNSGILHAKKTKFKKTPAHKADVFNYCLLKFLIYFLLVL